MGDLLQNHLIVFLDLTLEMAPISECRLDLLIQLHLIFHFFSAVEQILIGYFPDFLSFSVDLCDCLPLPLDHLLKVAALECQWRNGLLILGFVQFAYFNQDIESLLLEKRIGILVFDL